MAGPLYTILMAKDGIQQCHRPLSVLGSILLGPRSTDHHTVIDNIILLSHLNYTATYLDHAVLHSSIGEGTATIYDGSLKSFVT